MSTTNAEVYNVRLHMTNVYDVDVQASSRAEAHARALIYYDADTWPDFVIGSQCESEECLYSEVDGVEFSPFEEDE